MEIEITISYQTIVGDLGAAEKERLQLGQALEMYQSCVRDLGTSKLDPNNFSLFIALDPAVAQFLQCGNGIDVRSLSM